MNVKKPFFYDHVWLGGYWSEASEETIFNAHRLGAKSWERFVSEISPGVDLDSDNFPTSIAAIANFVAYRSDLMC